MTLIDMSTVYATDTYVSGFQQPWGVNPWSVREGRLSAPQQTSQGHRMLTLSAVRPVSDAEVIALTQAYYTSTIDNRTQGANRGVAVRVSGGSGSETAVFADVVTTDVGLTLRVRQIASGVTTTLASTRIGGWNRFWADQLIRIRLRASGATVLAKAWMETETEPRWMLRTTTTVRSAGRVGLTALGDSIQEYAWLGVSTDASSAPQGETTLVDHGNADFSGLVPLAVSMCYPMTASGFYSPESQTHPLQDREVARPGFIDARIRAIKIATKNRTVYPPPGDLTLGYSHCSRFSGTLIINTIDPLFAADYTGFQNDYVADSRNGWVQVGTGATYDPSWCQPGDVWITDVPGHVFVWIGTHGGRDDVVAEGAFNGMDEQWGLSRVGALRRFYLDAQGKDNVGRTYTAWRFMGRPGKALRLQTSSGLHPVQAHLQTRSGLRKISL